MNTSASQTVRSPSSSSVLLQGSAVQIADAYLQRHDLDKVFQWLDRAYRQRDGGLLSIKARWWSQIAADPRYMAFLKKMNLPE